MKDPIIRDDHTNLVPYPTENVRSVSNVATIMSEEATAAKKDKVNVSVKHILEIEMFLPRVDGFFNSLCSFSLCSPFLKLFLLYGVIDIFLSALWKRGSKKV